MGLILNIDTATSVCSTALSRGGVVVCSNKSKEQNNHSEVLSVMIEELFAGSGFKLSDIEAIAVSAGPGSYTGLRIGVSTAKGLCYALGVPLISIPSLQIIAAATLQEIDDNTSCLLCPMIDARRMEVYAAIYDSDLRLIRNTEAVILNESMFDLLDTNSDIILSGNGADKIGDIFVDNKHIKIISGVNLNAEFMAKLAEDKFERSEFESLAYYEPFYLKEFIAGKPSVKGLV